MTKKHLKSIFVGGAIILILASSGLVIYLLYLIKTNSNPVYLPQIVREKIADFNSENYDDLLIKIGVTGTGNGAYQDGDIVMIRPSTHKWSKREQTEFLIVRVPKLTDEQKRELVKPMKKNEEIIKRRMYGIDYTNILNQKKIVLIRQKRKEFRRKPLIDLSQIIKKAPSQISVIPENKRLVKAKLDPPKYIVYLNKIKNYFFSSVKAAPTQVVHTIRASGGDYTTLTSWEAAQQRDLVAADEIEIAECYNDWPDGLQDAPVIDGWTTDDTRYIKICTPASERHNGTAGTGFWLKGDTGWVESLTVSDPYVVVEGLEITASLSNAYRCIYINVGSKTGWVRISHCLLHDATVYYPAGIRVVSVGTLYAWNNIIYNIDNGSYGKGILVNSDGCDTAYIYNNTMSDCYTYGIDTYGSVIHAKNNLVQNCGTSCFNGSFNSASDYNASDDSSSTGGAHDRTNQTFTFVDEANDDFHLAPNDTGARNYGTDLSSDPNLSFNDDIDGETRSGTWDIGADEETPVEFVSTIMESGGDYDSLSSWEDAIECDLTSTSTRVYSFSDHSGTIPDGTTVSTDSGASTATLLHQSNLNNQVLLVNIHGSFDAGDVVTDGTNTVTLSNNGAPAIAVAKIDGTWTSPDTTPVTIDGWTTDADHYIRIYTTETARHNGKWDESKYRLEVDLSAGQAGLRIQEPHVRIEGIQIFVTPISQSGTFYYRGVAILNSSYDAYLSHNIVRGNFSSWAEGQTRAFGIHAGPDMQGPLYIWNNLIYDFDYATHDRAIGIFVENHASGKSYVYNNTVHACGRGIRDGYSDIIAKNNIVQDCTDGFYGTFHDDSNYNISDISGDAPGSNSKTCTVSFADEANDDFRLAVSDTAARDAGTNLSGDSNLSFTDDIDGETRPGGAAWDIGADELKKAAQINTPITNKFTSGLVGYWTFNGADIDWSTNTAYDRSGQGNNGTIHGAKPAIGKVGQALEFDGINDYVDCGNGPSLDITDAITVEAWVKSDTNKNGRIVSKHGGGSYGWMLSQRGSDIEWRISTTGSDWNGGFTSPSSFKINAWYHIAATYDGSYMRVYIDGVEDTGGDFPVDLTGSINIAPASTQIGRCELGGDIFSGVIDEVRIYNRALSAEEIAEHYRAGARKFKIDPTKSGKTIIK